MARLLKCEDMGFDCDYLCAETEEELVNKAAQYVKVKEGWIAIPNEFQEGVFSLSRPVDRG